MNVWLSVPFLPADDLRALALAAQDAGVAGLSLSEHVCVPASFDSPYPYNRGKPVALPPETNLPDPLVAIAALGSVATRIRFMTGVLIAPLRHPVMLAKEVATVAGMTGGRIDLGLGVGWLREEFEALGRTDFDCRGAMTSEMIPLLRRLWTGKLVAHSGANYCFEALAVNPTPPAPVPIFVGGTSQPAIRRCAMYGDGWIGANHSIEELEDVLGRLAAERARAGIDGHPFEIRCGLRGTVTPERLSMLRSLGVDSFLVAPWQLGDRRDSVFDLPVEQIAAALPELVDQVSRG